MVRTASLFSLGLVLVSLALALPTARVGCSAPPQLQVFLQTWLLPITFPLAVILVLRAQDRARALPEPLSALRESSLHNL